MTTLPRAAGMVLLCLTLPLTDGCANTVSTDKHELSAWMTETIQGGENHGMACVANHDDKGTNLFLWVRPGFDTLAPLTIEIIDRASPAPPLAHDEHQVALKKDIPSGKPFRVRVSGRQHGDILEATVTTKCQLHKTTVVTKSECEIRARPEG